MNKDLIDELRAELTWLFINIHYDTSPLSDKCRPCLIKCFPGIKYKSIIN